MKNLFYIMGKSSTGKDTIYQEIKNKIEINSYIRYTTRPKRANEKNGREYFFISNKQLEAFEKSNKIMESRSYNVINNNGKADIWTYATIADEQLEKRGDFLTIGTLASYNTLRKYIQEHPETDIKIIPIYINVSEDEIRSAMIKIIKSQGKVCIMSRDLSWVNPEVSDCLKKKKDNLLIFAQKETELTKKLKEAGIQIRYYGDTHFEPQTRFTIIGYNKPTPQVAISRTQYTIRKRGKLNHKIYQTSMSGDERDMWINSLALDMIDLCELVSKEK